MPKALAWHDTAFGPRPDCDRCEEYMLRPHFAGACASVGISHGKSTDEMVRVAVGAFHGRGHR